MVALPPPLVALSPGDLEPVGVDAFLRRTRAAVDAGLRGILLREAELADKAFLELARELIGLPVWLGIHDRAAIARIVGAQGVHLGFRSLRPRTLRPWLGATFALGLSTHAGDDSATWKAADYLFHGPVRPTASKAGLVEPVGFDGLARAVVAAAPVPVWAIGGMRPADVAPALAAGARGIAVLGGILGAADTASAAAEYTAAFHAAGGVAR